MLNKAIIKPFLIVVLFISLFTIAAQCGVAPGMASSTPEPQEVEKETVTIAYNGFFEKTFGPAAPPIEAIQAEVAKKYPNIEVQLNVMPYEARPWREQYVSWFEAQDGTTDLIGVSTYWTPEFAEKGWLLPLRDKIDASIIEKLNPSYLDAFTYEDKLIALGPWWGGIGGLYYRKDLLEQYGFEPPQTYDELVEISQTIMADNPELYGWVWPASKDQVLVNRWTEYFNGFGGQYFDESGQCTINNPEGVASLEFMINLVQDEITPLDALSWKEEESQVPFVNGKAIFLSGRQDLTFWLDDPEQSQIGEKWGLIPMPATAQGRNAGFFEGWGFGINKYSDNPEAAAKVLEVMFDFEVQKLFNLSQGPIQGHVDVYSDSEVIENNPNMPLINAIADTAVPAIPSPHYSSISTILQDELHLALIGIKPAEQALNDACQQIDAMNN